LVSEEIMPFGPLSSALKPSAGSQKRILDADPSCQLPRGTKTFFEVNHLSQFMGIYFSYLGRKNNKEAQSADKKAKNKSQNDFKAQLKIDQQRQLHFQVVS